MSLLTSHATKLEPHGRMTCCILANADVLSSSLCLSPASKPDSTHLRPKLRNTIAIVYFHNEIELLSMLDVQDAGCAGNGHGAGFVGRGVAMNTQNDATPSSWYAIKPTQLDCDLTTSPPPSSVPWAPPYAQAQMTPDHNRSILFTLAMHGPSW